MALPTRDDLDAEVDREFARQFPDAPKRLDHSVPEHAAWIDDWLRIRDKILASWADAAFAAHFPAAGRLDPDDPGDAQLIDYWTDIRDQILDGPPGRYDWNEEPDPGRPSDDDVIEPDPGMGTEVVDIGEAEEARITEWVEAALEGGHVLGSTSEVVDLLAEGAKHVAGEAGRVAAISRSAGRISAVLGPISDALFVVWAAFEVIDAFRSERRSTYTQGFVYGVMWEALDEPDHIPRFAAGITYSPAEHEEAFVEGVAAGRSKATDPMVRNRIILVVATLGLTSGLGDFYAANKVLSQLWRSLREPAPGDSHSDSIRWPVPYDRNELLPQ